MQTGPVDEQSAFIWRGTSNCALGSLGPGWGLHLGFLRAPHVLKSLKLSLGVWSMGSKLAITKEPVLKVFYV